MPETGQKGTLFHSQFACKSEKIIPKQAVQEKMNLYLSFKGILMGILPDEI